MAFAAAPATWQEEAEKAVHPGGLRFGAAVVDDPSASGGKAVRIPWPKDARGWEVQFGAPKARMQGQCLFKFHLRAEGMSPISDGLRITVIAHDKQTGLWAFNNNAQVYGINLKPQGYTAVTIPLEVAFKPDEYTPEVLFEWCVGTEGVAPVLFLDKVEITTPVLDAPAIKEVWPSKMRYRPKEKAAVTVTVVNPLDRPFKGSLVGEDRWGLDRSRAAFRQEIRLEAGEEKSFTANWALGPAEYGHEIVVQLKDGDQVIDTGAEFFGVHKTPLWLSVGNTGDFGRYTTGPRGGFFVEPASFQESWRGVRELRRHSPGQERFEFFSWSPGDISDQAPQEDPFPGGEGRMTYRSRALIRRQIEMMISAGIWPISYVNGTCWADSGYKLFSRHPEWFLYDANGEVAHYEMDSREKYRFKDTVNFDPATYPGIYFQAVLNHSLPGVQEYIAQQYVKCGKAMGFKGVRMDVRYIEVYPGERGFDGKEIAPTHEQADRISAAAIKHVKELVHREIPDFTFGYNYASPDETKDMPLAMKERCAGGGWMLDEVVCGYNEKTSPFHVWEAFMRRMTSWGDQVNQWGGIYKPYDFRRGDIKSPADKLYSSIFRLVAGGRSYFCPYFFNSRLPTGNFGRFVTRYSELFYNTERDWVPEIKGEVDVKAAAPVWWKDMVYWSRNAEGQRQLIVNLVNPPAAAEVEENPQARINPPVRDIRVICAKAGGQLPKSAFLVMAEPLEPTDPAELKSVPLDLKTSDANHASVTVPSVLFWKIVVFQF